MLHARNAARKSSHTSEPHTHTHIDAHKNPLSTDRHKFAHKPTHSLLPVSLAHDRRERQIDTPPKGGGLTRERYVSGW